jgi:predicted Zn-dependent peptidase
MDLRPSAQRAALCGAPQWRAARSGSVRVLVDAGSFYETDAQQGFAHLIEHLTFRDPSI